MQYLWVLYKLLGTHLLSRFQKYYMCHTVFKNCFSELLLSIMVVSLKVELANRHFKTLMSIQIAFEYRRPVSIDKIFVALSRIFGTNSLFLLKKHRLKLHKTKVGKVTAFVVELQNILGAILYNYEIIVLT